MSNQLFFICFDQHFLTGSLLQPTHRYPVYSCVRECTSKLVTELNVHSAGVTLSAFTAPDAKGAQRLVTVSQGDGSLMVWDIQA